MRFYKLGEWSYWIDEIATINRVQLPLGELATSINTNLSSILTNIALSTLGVNEWSARLAPAVLGIITIPVAYFPIKAVFKAKTAMIAVLLIAFSPWHLFWSQSSRFYTSLVLFYFLAMFAFYYGLEKDRLTYILLGLVFFAFAFQERFLSLLLVPVLLLYILVVRWSFFDPPKGLNRRNLLPLAAVGLVGLLVVIYDGIQYSTSGSSAILTELGWFFARPIDDPFRLGMFILLSLGIPVVVLGTFSGGFLISKRSRAGLFFSIGALLPVILILIANPFMFTEARYVFVTLPCWIILAAAGIQSIFSVSPGESQLLGWAVLLIVVVSSLSSHLLYYTANHGDRYDWESSFNFVERREEDGDVLVSTRPQIGAYYYPEVIESYQEMGPEDIETGGGRYWFVVDSEKIWDNREMKEWLEENAVILDFQYLRVPEELNLRVYFYEPGS